MILDEVYTWLLNNLPDYSQSSHIKLIWVNMASYCYFMNMYDVNSKYSDRLKQVLQISKEHDIRIPNKDHAEIIDTVNNFKESTVTIHDEVMELMNGRHTSRIKAEA